MSEFPRFLRKKGKESDNLNRPSSFVVSKKTDDGIQGPPQRLSVGSIFPFYEDGNISALLRVTGPTAADVVISRGGSRSVVNHSWTFDAEGKGHLTVTQNGINNIATHLRGLRIDKDGIRSNNMEIRYRKIDSSIPVTVFSASPAPSPVY